MNAKNIKLKALAIVIVVIAGSCIDYYKISTKVNIDGSLERTIQVVGDSTEIFNGNLFIPTDTSWNINTKWIFKNPEDTLSEERYVYTANRYFKNVEELNEFLKVPSDTSPRIKITTDFNKKFRWFYTYIEYRENYFKSMPFNHFPVSDFLTPGELSFTYDDEYTYDREKDSLIHLKDLKQMPLLRHQDSLRMEELENEIIQKLSLFLAKNIFEEYYLITCSELKNFDPVKFDFFKENKEHIYKESKIEDAYNFTHDNDLNPFENIAGSLGLSEDSVRNINPTVFKIFYTKLENSSDKYLEGNEIKNSITMPGLLLSTNADSISNSESYWNFNEQYFFAEDYLLSATSRIINKWAFVVSGIVIVLLVTFLLKAFLKR